MRTNFKNAREAFIYFYNEINSNGVVFGDTKALFNVGFTLENPSQKNIPFINLPNPKLNTFLCKEGKKVSVIGFGTVSYQKELSLFLKNFSYFITLYK